MASVRKREWTRDGKKKSAWVVDFKDERGKRALKTFTMKKAADAFLQKTQQQIEVGTFVADGNSVIFEAATADWLEHCRKRAERMAGLSRSGVEMYDIAIRRALPHIGQKLITKVRLADIQAVTDALCTAGLSGASVRHTIRTTRMVFDFAIERQWLRLNPIDTKKLVLPPARKIVHIPSKDELRHLLQVACKRAPHEKEAARRIRVAIATLALFGGLRRGEIAGLKRGDVDFERGTMRIRRSVSRLDGIKSTKTAAGVREVPLVLPIAEALRGLPSYVQHERTPDAFVIRTGTGLGLQGCSVYSDYWHPLILRAGLVKPDGKPLYRLHDLRHTAASLLIDQGLSPLHIKTMMGHASVTTTLDVYGHLFPADGAIKKAADEVAASLLATQTRHEQSTPQIALIRQ
ncbi:MAG: site-specific integrase [Methylorubrum populi]